MNSVVEQMLRRVPQDSDGERSQAMRQVMQEIALAGLVRRGFFAKAAFYGGTCLRLFHQLPRFSEDLDFSLLQPDPGFRLQPYLQGMEEEFSGLGIEVQIREKQNINPSPILSAFLKASTTIVQLAITGSTILRIKFEVDTDPPFGFSTEEQLLLQPYSCYVKCFSLPDLFAGKMHAVLFRQWQQRVKGRDWFDLEWYVRGGIPLHLDHLAERARQSGHWPLDQPFSASSLQALLAERIGRLDVDKARLDIERFIAQPEPLAIWSQDYFQQLAQRVVMA
ncbi:nucleotidyl transferase AbiEii/AbiGii toxin family protein [Cyanobium gracile UHCC 0139]|uniref:Nucleotidyl transferase AbiEii/AbiGii toxin family protein n=1 Tax=Cyanobium gracile UHCC 0139 TaxID=3110308 RepID=A0ABU5RUJ5_9CYAN|nr:nucleotidyl transferase AbiEii/AbiGii toxin family protein [Cyanobium gracile]MEA5391457.1 nucleotidyl transferase AbiEii/AbiGii toxin family protein [Cyanobium gracile UHCC 0139]